MRRAGERHPIFEGLVFGFALLLGVILLFYGAKAWLARRGRPMPVSEPVTATAPLEPQVPLGPSGSATESAVVEIPPVRLSRGGGLRGRASVDVPAPHRTAKKK